MVEIKEEEIKKLIEKKGVNEKDIQKYINNKLETIIKGDK